MAFDEVGRPQGERRSRVAAGQARSRGDLRQHGLGDQRDHPEDDEGAPTDDRANEMRTAAIPFPTPSWTTMPGVTRSACVRYIAVWTPATMR